MERWIEFIGNHPFLFGLLAVLLIAFFAIETKRSGKKVPPSEVGLLVNNHNARIIDIRPAAKFATGHITGSQNIPFAELKNHLTTLQAIEVPVIIVCDMGIQAGAAVQLINRPNVMRLEGGIANYQAAGLPLVGAKK
ncbi:rhodanese-like domain-containing protein [Moraxella sp.]|uniref:rhodanese-like domain-containing protein n=1 Tax=Moraxella sp. TaxID=479 RepID=UPI0026DD8797|nr:rhodanese-like domain-containing protein [Moraxella sp.]MDO4894138.1 rhodanese-like domain-containing protein [Moraxella sp.]